MWCPKPHSLHFHSQPPHRSGRCIPYTHAAQRGSKKREPGCLHDGGVRGRRKGKCSSTTAARHPDVAAEGEQRPGGAVPVCSANGAKGSRGLACLSKHTFHEMMSRMICALAIRLVLNTAMIHVYSGSNTVLLLQYRVQCYCPHA